MCHRRIWRIYRTAGHGRKEYEQVNPSNDTNTALRDAIQALLGEDLTDRELAYRLRALLPPTEEQDAPPTTDEATDHPGYQ